MSANGQLRIIEGGRVAFMCPGCKSFHMIRVQGEGGPIWTWNGSHDAPTFTPSVLLTYNGPDAGINGAPPAVCHSFVTDGRIPLLSDCTHDLAGQPVDLPDVEGL
jgi:hypothetical protein